MKFNECARSVRNRFLSSIFVACTMTFVAHGPAQSAAAPAQSSKGVTTALMVSDIHFEPFWDSEKTVKLAAAPVAEWKGIFSAPDSPEREIAFAALEQKCKTRGEDTTYALFGSSLRAMNHDASDAKFVTVSGDLIAHSFDCKFKAVFPKSAPGDYSAFVEKTIEFVIGSLREALPDVPVYAALGNNDSDCGDYDLDPNSDFLAAIGKTLTADVPTQERRNAEKDFAAGGYYEVSLPAPMTHARLIVLDDLFMSRHYKTCGGADDETEAAAQISWMKRQLEGARRKNEKIWVMAHIPPGVDAYSTASKGVNICGGKDPTMFLSSEELPETIADYGDVVKLAIFAHTHMDELRLLESANTGGVPKEVAAKLVPSISPINGNNPSFTVARVDAETGTLKDYRVIAASNATGADTKWSDEYDFARTYGGADFSANSVERLIGAFAGDVAGETGASQSYIRNYQLSAGPRDLKMFWPQYTCMLKHHNGKSFSECVCGTKP